MNRPEHNDEILVHGRFLRNLARGLVADPHLADDLAQDAMVAALRAPQPRTSWRSYLAGTVRNLARMRWRSEGRRRQHEERTAMPSPEPDRPDVVAERLEIQESVARAVRELPEPYRGTVFLRFLEDRSAAEIAKRHGVPASTVRSRVQKALAMLRERLDALHGDRARWQAALLPLLRRPRPWPVLTGAALLRVALVAAVVLSAGALWVWSGGGEESGPRARQEAGTPDTKPELLAEQDGAVDSSPVHVFAPDRERDLFGVVVDDAGEPVPGARLFTTLPISAADLLHTGDPAPGPRGVTDAAGRFALRLSPGARATLHVTADFHPVAVVRKCQAGERVRVVLSRTTGELAVQTVPVAGIAVRSLPHTSFTARSDAAGRAVLRLPVGQVRVTVEHPRGGTARALAEVPGRVELQPEPGRRLTGFVRDERGRPLNGVRVGEEWELRRSVVTDEEGRYAIWTRAAKLFAFAPGYGTAQRHVESLTTADFVLHDGDECAGRVLDRDGALVAGALVVAMASRHDDVMQHVDSRHARTDERGRFLLTSLRRDLPHTLVVQAAGHGRRLVDFKPHPDAAGRVRLGDIVLPAPCSLSGRVVSGGAPLARAPVTLRLLEAHYLESFYGATESRRTDDLGRFRFVDLGPGRYELSVRAPGRPALTRTVAVDGDVAGLEVAVPAAASLRVRVVDTDGDAVPGAHVRVAQRHFADTDAQGRAVVEGLENKEYTLRVFPGRTMHFAFPGRSVTPGAEEVTVVLHKAVQVRGRVLSADGKPLGGLFVTAVDPATRRVRTRVATDASGRFALRLRTGARIDIVADGTRPHPLTDVLDVFGVARDVSAPADGIELRTGAMPHDRELACRVVDPDGVPVEGVRIEAHGAHRFPRPDPAARVAKTGRDGRVRFSNLARRRLRVVVRGAPAGLVGPAPAELWPSQGALELRLVRGVAYGGVVRFADGRPAAGARIVLRTMEGDRLGEVVTDDEGRFAMLGRPGVKHQIYAALRIDDAFTHERYLHRLEPTAELEIVLPKRPQ